MEIKERIIEAVRNEVSREGFIYVKSQCDFKRKINANTTLYLGFIVGGRQDEVINISLHPSAVYHDIEEALFAITPLYRKQGHLSWGCRLQWILPEGESQPDDYIFRARDDEKSLERRLNVLLVKIRDYALPFLEKLCNSDDSIREIQKFDLQKLYYFEGVVPIMYCLWKHNKMAALNYMEEKRLRLLGWVEPWEWELVERFKRGERFGENNPFHALNYEEYLAFIDRFKAWIEGQGI